MEIKKAHNIYDGASFVELNEKYAKISITEDFTRAERELIKHWKNNADQKNRIKKNQTYFWRVRGSPRDSRGLYLKKIFTKTCVYS